jgi:uncharacterized membrane protein HdeD (DUF308 family)
MFWNRFGQNWFLSCVFTCFTSWNFQEQTEIMTSLLAAAPLFHSVVKKWSLLEQKPVVSAKTSPSHTGKRKDNKRR